MPFTLPAETMPRQTAQTAPTMANFDYISDIFRLGTNGWVLTFDNTVVHNCKWAPGGGGGGGTVTSITATSPVVVTPSPITNTGVISALDFVASGASHARGVVPDPGAVAGTSKFLREDATFATPPFQTVNVYFA